MSSEHDLQIIRLTSICPPDALRPHFQEAYVLTEYPTVNTSEQKEAYRRGEFDFARRLLCKFVIPASGFWSSDFQPIPESALFPDKSRLESAASVRLDAHPGLGVQPDEHALSELVRFV